MAGPGRASRSGAGGETSTTGWFGASLPDTGGEDGGRQIVTHPGATGRHSDQHADTLCLLEQHEPYVPD